MPSVTRAGAALRYECDGEGPPVVFVGDAGLGVWVWGWQVRALAGPHAAVTVDLRGGGHSDAPPGPYSVADLSADLRAVCRDAPIDGRPHLVGCGLGGMVALEYATHNAVRSLALLGTAATGDAVDRAAYERALPDPTDRTALVDSLDALLSAGFREQQAPVCEQIADWRAADDAGPVGRDAQLAALAGFDATDRLHELTAPALVLHGRDDALVSAAVGEHLAEGLPRGEFRGFDGAGHLVGVERSRPVNDALDGFLAAVEAGDR